MQNLPYMVMAGALLISLAAAIIGGGIYWIIPAIMWPLVGIYAIFDRRLRKSEGRGEQLEMKAKPD
jgi:hypothetical protein